VSFSWGKKESTESSFGSGESDEAAPLTRAAARPRARPAPKARRGGLLPPCKTSPAAGLDLPIDLDRDLIYLHLPIDLDFDLLLHLDLDLDLGFDLLLHLDFDLLLHLDLLPGADSSTRTPRDDFRCQNPECRRRTLRAHAHHKILRSKGGGDSGENGDTHCPSCHLRLVHAGRIAVEERQLEGVGPVQLWRYPGRVVVVF